MKKFLFFLFGLLLTIGAYADTYSTGTISTKQWGAAGAQALGSASWTLTTDGGYFGVDASKGQQIGSSKAAATKISLSTEDITGTITSVKVNTSGAASIVASCAVKVGDTAFGEAKALTADPTEYTFTGSATGKIEISWVNSSAKAIYIRSIEVEYTGGGASVPVESVSILDKNGKALDESFIVLTQGDSYTFKASVQPENATNKAVNWKILQNSDVVSLTNATVKALAPGKASLVVTTVDGEKQTYVTINVVEPEVKTVAEFLESKGGSCYLVGTVGEILSADYGNYDLTDESGTIRIYGTLTPAGEKKQFATLGVQAGDYIKVLATEYKAYTEKDGSITDEAVNVVFVEKTEKPQPMTFDMEFADGFGTITPSKDDVTYGVCAYNDQIIDLFANLGMTFSNDNEVFDAMVLMMLVDSEHMRTGVDKFDLLDFMEYLGAESIEGDYTIMIAPCHAEDMDVYRDGDVTSFKVTVAGAADEIEDCTSQIVNPGFTDDSSSAQSGWTLVTGKEKGKWSKGTENRGFSCNNIKCELTQTVEGLKPGKYMLKYQAFGRMKANDASWTSYLAGEDLGSTNVYMIANDTKKEVMNVVHGATPTKGAGDWTTVKDAEGNTLYLLNNSGAVADAFAQGYYEDSLETVVGEDGKLTITFQKESVQDSGSDYSKYAGCDNFRLYRIGDAEVSGPAELVSITPEVGSKVDINTEYVITFSQPVTYSTSMSDIAVGYNPFSNEDGAIFTQSEDKTQITCKLDAEVLEAYGIKSEQDLIAKMGNKVYVHLFKVRDAATGELVEGCYDELEDLDQFSFQFKLGDPVLVAEPADGETLSVLESINFSCSDGIALSETVKDIYVMKNKESIMSIPSSDLEAVVSGGWGWMNDDDDFGFGGMDDDDWGFGDDQSVLYYTLTFPTAITEKGNYEIYIPAGTFLLDGTPSKTAIFSYYVDGNGSATPSDGLAVTPAAGKVESLKDFEFSYNNGEIISPSSMDGCDITIANEAGEVVATITQDDLNMGIDESCLDETGWNVIRCKASLAEAITAPGTYTMTIPASAFYVSDNYEDNEEATFVWTIEAPQVINVTPAEGIVASLQDFEFTFADGAIISPSFMDGCDITIKNEAGEVLATITQDDLNNGIDDTCLDETGWNVIRCKASLAEAITAAGTYTMTIPASTFYVTDDYVDNEETTFTWTIEGPSTIIVSSDLTSADFFKWTAADATAEKVQQVNPEYNLNTATQMVYGFSTVDYLHFADLSDATALEITATEGTPRLLFNRTTDGGAISVEYPRDGSYAQVVDNGDGSKTYTIDIAAIVAKDGFAHLHAIKGANWANTVVTSMKVIKEVAAPKGEPVAIPSMFSGVVDSEDTMLSATEAVDVEVAEGMRINIYNCPEATYVTYAIAEVEGQAVCNGEIDMTMDSYVAFDAPTYFAAGKKYQVTLTVYDANRALLGTYAYVFNGTSANVIGDADGINTIKVAADGKYMKNGKVVIVKNGKNYNVSGLNVK